MNMRAIETLYKGYRFRSRLEARWAVFIEELGWSWEYEKEGFVLEDKTHYLPDFYISELRLWLEVKPSAPTEEEIKKCLLLSKGFGENVYVGMGIGLPEFDKYLKVFVDGADLGTMTITQYIRYKQWGCPYFGGYWDNNDKEAFAKAKQARFEFEEYNQ